MPKTLNGYEYSIGNGRKKYTFNKEHQHKITAVLTQAKETMINPVAAHYVIYVNYDFAINSLIPKLRRLIKEKNKMDFMFFYSIEQTYSQKKYKTVHIHLWLIVDIINTIDIDNLFNTVIINDLQTLANVATNYDHPEKEIFKRMWYQA